MRQERWAWIHHSRFKQLGYKSDPFILACQAKQVFYIKDQIQTKWCIVCHMPIISNLNQINEDKFNNVVEYPLFTENYQLLICYIPLMAIEWSMHVTANREFGLQIDDLFAIIFLTICLLLFFNYEFIWY